MSEIQNELAKESLVKAKDFIKQESYEKAISHATAGLDIMFMEANEFFFGEFSSSFDPYLNLTRISSIKGIYVEKSANKPEISSDLKRGIESLKYGVQHLVELHETIICYYLGINIEQYIRYRKMAGYFGLTGNGEVYSESGLFPKAKFEFEKKDAELAVDYCTKTIINIEEALERLNKPLSDE